MVVCFLPMVIIEGCRRFWCKYIMHGTIYRMLSLVISTSVLEYYLDRTWKLLKHISNPNKLFIKLLHMEKRKYIQENYSCEWTWCKVPTLGASLSNHFHRRKRSREKSENSLLPNFALSRGGVELIFKKQTKGKCLMNKKYIQIVYTYQNINKKWTYFWQSPRAYWKFFS